MKDLVENDEIVLDTSGTECPIPVLKARKLASELKEDVVIPAGTYDLTFFPSSPKNPQQGNLKIETPKGGPKKSFAPKPQYGTGVRV